MAVASVWSVTAQEDKAIIDKVIATVGGELILLSEVEEQRALMEAQQGKSNPDSRCQIMDQLLTNNLLLNQSKLDSIEVTDQEVEAQLDARIERILSYMNNDVSQFEAYYGASINDVKERFREDLQNQLLIERMRSQILSSVTVTPSEVKEFYHSIPRDSLPYFNSEVEVSEIVRKPRPTEAERQRTVERLREIRRQIVEEGADFAEIARKQSEDGSARKGGDLGWTKRGDFVYEFEAAAYRLKDGEISKVVESKFGYHLIQLLERRGNSIHTRHILLKPDITRKDEARARAYLDSVRNLIRTDTSLTFSIAVKRFSEEEVQSFNNDGRIVNNQTGDTFFETGDLDPDIYFTIDTMEIGQISDPFEFSGPDGSSMYRIVKLNSRTDPHRANLQEDYSKIRKAAIESKKSEYVSEWIQKKVGETFIQIDPIYSGCENLLKWRQREVVRP